MDQDDVEVRLTVNGEKHCVPVSAQHSLAQLLRDQLGLTGTKIGCQAGECGACTVVADGRAVCACLVPALRADGMEVITIEGTGTPDQPSTLQRALVEHGAFQCGFCTPGVVMSLTALFDRTPRPSEQQIRIALQDNVCRCTGYLKIIAAAQAVAQGHAP